MNTRIIALTGGIGSGKSVVSRVLLSMGYPVYDSDSRAKAIIDSSPEAKARIKDEIDAACISDDGAIDRKRLASIVFNDAAALSRLNSIVHALVLKDFAAWCESRGTRLAFIETALLYQSGLDKCVDEVWDVDAPLETRISRVCNRDRCTDSDVMARIKSQQFIPERYHHNIKRIINDDHHSLLIRINELLTNE